MKINYECAPCMLRQSKEAIEYATNKPEERMKITLKALDFLNNNFIKNTCSNKLGTDLHHMIMKETDNNDPYKDLREQGTVIAEKLIPQIREIIKDDDTLENYVKIAVAGNMIDYGALEVNADVESLIKDKISAKPTINDVDKLHEQLLKSDRILYLVDNGGEIVFDKLLIEKIREDYDIQEIILAVKDAPILNDAILEDAEKLGLDKITTLITTGAASVGVVEEYISDELKELLNSVDLIISKGMGNFEGLTEMTIERPVYFLLTSKCCVISREIGVELGSTVILKKYFN